ncbi:major outer membrane protein [Halarcobacter anaerophilus]|uniref:major outer membrane protein n=1 Tax=Halarcobacter anaerophilus TaxID=877500 RepID=UPI0005CA880D|nr:major outer membrane protein [Halarcobacter anaerophilus]
MKKFAKMSLVAALAVAGTTASAQPLTEAIKNVDVSGSVVYRYDDYSSDKNYDDKDNNKYKIGLTAKAKVNDDVTAITRFIIGSSDSSGDFASLNHSSGGDGNHSDENIDVKLSQVYFSYTGIKNTTVNVGKQGLTTPWTVAIDIDGQEQTGTGILALSNLGPVTVAAAYFNQTNLDLNDAKINGNGYEDVDVKDVIDGAEDIVTIGLLGSIGPVALDAWYLDIDEVFDTYTVGADAKFNIDAVKLNLGARYTYLDLDDEITDALRNLDNDNSLAKVYAGINIGIFGAKVAYAWTDEDGGLVALDNDSSKTNLHGWNLTANGYADATFLKSSVDAQVLDSLNISLNYNQLEVDDKDIRDGGDFTDTEYYLQATYKMSKNFGGYIRFGEMEKENIDDGKDRDTTIGRLQIQYTF